MNRRVRVFFRDDDVDELSSNLQEFVSRMLARDLPVNYQVTPGRLTDETSDYLREIAGAHPGRVTLNQHGNRHEQILNGAHRWSEFAGEIPYDEQLATIREGRERLEKSLGEHFAPDVFTPPAHKYDENTLRALAWLGFSALSAAYYPSLAGRVCYGVGRLLRRVTFLRRRVSYHMRQIPRCGLVEVSTAIDVDMRKRGGRLIVKSVEDLDSEFRSLCGRLDVVGIQLHHHTYTPAKFDVLERFLDRVLATPGVEVCRIEDLARSVVA